MASATPTAGRTPEECGRSAALAPNAPWIERHVAHVPEPWPGKSRLALRRSLQFVAPRPACNASARRAFAGLAARRRGMLNFALVGVDNPAAAAYIRPSTARRRLGAKARLSKLLTDRVTKQPISVGGLELRRLSGVPEGRDRQVPGCLTGESEERETWTAESLRAASSIESASRGAAGRDFGGTRFRSTYWSQFEQSDLRSVCRTSSKRE